MKAERSLPASEIRDLLRPFAPCLAVLDEAADSGASQTGYGTTELPGTVALGADLRWLGRALDNPAVSLVLARQEIVDLALKRRSRLGKTVLVYQDPAQCFYRLHNAAIHERCYTAERDRRHSVAASARIHPSAVIEEPVCIEEDVEIGPLVVVRAGTRIGAGAVIHERCTIGSQGLFTKILSGRPEQIAFFGGVEIGARSRLHAGVNVCRAVNFGTATVIEADVSCGPQSNIGHDCVVERGSVLSCKVALMGRARIGPEVWIGAGAMVSNGIEVGRAAKVRIGAVVIKKVEPGTEVSGNFAIDHHRVLRRMF